MRRSSRVLIALAIAALALTAVGSALAAPAPSARYIVVLKTSHRAEGITAVRSAGGKIVSVNKLGIATVVSANRAFALQLRRSGSVAGVAHDAWFQQAPLARPQSFALRTAAINTVPAEQAACSALFGVPVSTGPDPLGACQWDMRAINATPAGSYAVNQGAGARIGDIDTGIDLTHPDLAPNLDVAASCSFIYATTPTSRPGGTGDGRRLLQQGGGPGPTPATARTRPGRSPRRSTARASPGVAPRATLVALKAGTAQGYFFTDSVVNAHHLRGRPGPRCREHELLRGSVAVQLPERRGAEGDRPGDQPRDVATRSSGASCWSRRPVTRASTSTIRPRTRSAPTSRRVPPFTRPVNNSCVVLPTELPGVVVVSATGAQNLLSWYSTYGNIVDVAAPGGSRFQTPTDDSARGRVLAPYSSTAADLAASLPWAGWCRTGTAPTTRG